MTFVLTDYVYTVGEYDSESMLYTVTPHRRYRHLTSYQSLTNAIIDINGVATPVVQYDGVYYIIRDLSFCFDNCAYMTSAPTIPATVRNLSACFIDCTSFNQPIVIPNSVTDMSSCFYNCTSFNQPIVIPSSVTNMSECFGGCTSLNQSITIPNSVTDMSSCFYRCTSFNQPIVIPNSVTDMTRCFVDCTSFNQPITIPDSITKMTECFYGCASFNQPVTIPSLITDMTGCFFGCTSFNQPIVIPYGVEKMEGCFYSCTSFNRSVVIPSSVTDIRYCFSECSALSNDIYVLSNNVSFNSTTFPSNNKPIHLYTYSADLAYSPKLPANVIVGTPPIYHMLNSRKLTLEENVTYGTTHGVRVDMLIDISNSGKLTGSTTTIYDMNDNEMDLDGYESLNGLLQCYSIVDVHNQVPTANLGISVTCIAPTQSYGIIGYPSTAESVRFYRNSSGGVDMAPRTNADMIYFNHKDSTDLGDTVKSALVYIISQYYPNYQYLNEINNRVSTNKMQINVSDGNDTDIKHFITTADYIMATNTKTVQDIINDLYTLSQS